MISGLTIISLSLDFAHAQIDHSQPFRHAYLRRGKANALLA